MVVTHTSTPSFIQQRLRKQWRLTISLLSHGALAYYLAYLLRSLSFLPLKMLRLTTVNLLYVFSSFHELIIIIIIIPNGM